MTKRCWLVSCKERAFLTNNNGMMRESKKRKSERDYDVLGRAASDAIWEERRLTNHDATRTTRRMGTHSEWSVIARYINTLPMFYTH